MNEIEQKAENAYNRLFKKRLDKLHDAWKCCEHTVGKQKFIDQIIMHLNAGHKVKAGYFITGIRGYHEYRIVYK